MRGICEHKRRVQSVAKRFKRRSVFCFSDSIRMVFAELCEFAKFAERAKIVKEAK